MKETLVQANVSPNDLNTGRDTILVIIVLVKISNSNWTEWSTFQGVIGRVIRNYKPDYFLNCTTITN